MINVSEGRDAATLGSVADAAGGVLLDVHTDPDHHRSVFTLGGADAAVESAARAVTERALGLLDLRGHDGVHPRLGAVDVVPFVALGRTADGTVADGDPARARAARDRFAAWAAQSLGLPCFLYGPVAPEPTLPLVRRTAWTSRWPDLGPSVPHPTGGACCVGWRPVLVAYNLWLATDDLPTARRVAAEVRTPTRRTLGLAVGGRTQVSCNLIDPWADGPDAAYRAVAGRVPVLRAELVGLVPAAVLDAVDRDRWSLLDLQPGRTIEARL